MIVFNCPSCGKEFTSMDEYEGRQFNCSNCDQGILIPTLKVRQTPSAIVIATSPTKVPATPPPLKNLRKASAKPRKKPADESSAPSERRKKSRETGLSKIFEKPRYMVAAFGGLITLQGTIFKIIEPSLFSTIALIVGMVVVVVALYVEIQSAFLRSLKNAGAYLVQVKEQRTRLAETRAKAEAEANAEVKALVAAAKSENGEEFIEREAVDEETPQVTPTAPKVPPVVAIGCLAMVVLPISCIAFLSSLPPVTEQDRLRTREEAAKNRVEDAESRNREKFRRDLDDLQYQLKRDGRL